MHSREYNRYKIAVNTGMIAHSDIKNEIEADRLLRNNGAYNLTTTSYIKKESGRNEDYIHLSLDSPQAVALVDSSNPFTDREYSNGYQAVLTYGTRVQLAIYKLDGAGLDRKQIAGKLGITLSCISKNLAKCQLHMYKWSQTIGAWQYVYKLEQSGKHINDTEEVNALTGSIRKIESLGIDVIAVGGKYLLAGHWLLRADQINTLAELGQVRTSEYGLVVL